MTVHSRYPKSFLVFALAIFLLQDLSYALGDPPTERPNILFILTDDQAFDSIGAYGNKVCSTPNLDQLAARGMRLDQAYHMGAFQGAVCNASRHMIMTGRTVWHIPGARSRNSVLKRLRDANPATRKTIGGNPNIPAKLESNTIGAVFNRAGYDTMRTCKKGNSYGAANQQFSVVKDKTNRGADLEKGSAWHADQVLAFLQQREDSKDADPFMIYFGFSHPHDSRNANEALLTKYGAVNELPPNSATNPNSPALPVNYLAAHPFHHGHPNLRDEVNVQGVKRLRDETTIRNEKGREYACIENIDAQIGRVLEKLKSMGELDNTYVLFTSDHGIAVGRHGLMGKQNLYEHSWRVPYIVAGPNIQPGGSAPGNVYLLDTLATICDLAGVEAPKTNEGTSFKSVLMGSKKQVRETMYGCYCGGTKPGMRSVRHGDWKLIKYETLDGKIKETQLFNLRDNPHELLLEHQEPAIIELTGHKPAPTQVNLAEDAQYTEKLKQMEALLLTEMERLDDPYRFDEGYINGKPKQRSKTKNNSKSKNNTP